MLFLIIILNYGTILNFLISESSQVLYLYFDFSENFFGKPAQDQLVHLEHFY